MKPLYREIEALIYASEHGISIEELKFVVDTHHNISTTEDEIKQVVDEIATAYSGNDLVFELKFINNAYQFLTKPAYHSVISQLAAYRSKRQLSQAAIETLSIIAYRQPITKLEIEQIRGVNCDYTIQRLLDKELIMMVGKADSLGKPILYSTSELFMDYFGVNSPADLPKLQGIFSDNNEIGQVND